MTKFFILVPDLYPYCRVPRKTVFVLWSAPSQTWSKTKPARVIHDWFESVSNCRKNWTENDISSWILLHSSRLLVFATKMCTKCSNTYSTWYSLRLLVVTSMQNGKNRLPRQVVLIFMNHLVQKQVLLLKLIDVVRLQAVTSFFLISGQPNLVMSSYSRLLITADCIGQRFVSNFTQHIYFKLFLVS